MVFLLERHGKYEGMSSTVWFELFLDLRINKEVQAGGIILSWSHEVIRVSAAALDNYKERTKQRNIAVITR